MTVRTDAKSVGRTRKPMRTGRRLTVPEISPIVAASLPCRHSVCRRFKHHHHAPVATARAAQSAFESRKWKRPAAGADQGLKMQFLTIGALAARSRRRAVFAAPDAPRPTTRQPSENASPMVSTVIEQIVYSPVGKSRAMTEPTTRHEGLGDVRRVSSRSHSWRRPRSRSNVYIDAWPHLRAILQPQHTIHRSKARQLSRSGATVIFHATPLSQIASIFP